MSLSDGAEGEWIDRVISAIMHSITMPKPKGGDAFLEGKKRRYAMPQEPRSGDVTVGGLPWLARMIDKARLEAAGEIEALDLEYPCPMDRRLLRQLGVESEAFQKIAVSATTDEQILFELERIGANLARA
jgi:hypothetical protein